MDYEKAYKEALNRAKSKIKNDKNYVLYEEDIIDIFPEFKKKTDEEMIQKLIAVCHLYYGEGEDAEKDECLEWLEKQNKNKPIERREFTNIPFGAFDSELYESMITIPEGCIATIEGNKIHIKREYKTATKAIKEEKVDNANKVEPKFKVGDIVVRKNGKNFNDGRKFAKVIKINKTISQPMYLVDCENWLYEDKIRLWTLSDAKAGDVLVSSIDKPFIYNGCYNKYEVGAYCGLNINNEFTIAYKQYYWTNNDSIRPATKEERETLFNEMNLLGWIWNPETKELNRLDKNEENNN